MKQASIISAIVLALLLLLLGSGAFYSIHQTETVIITQFGKVVGEPITEPGLHFKIPFVQEVNRLENRVLEWDALPTRMTTRDKAYLQVDAFARWKISNPLLYFVSLRDERSAQSRLDDIIGGSTLNTVARYDLIEIIRSDKSRKIEAVPITADDDSAPVSAILPIQKGRLELEKEILAEATASLKSIGIELLDVRFKRLNYSDETQGKIYERMISERAQIAERSRSEGAGEAARIEGDREAELKKIQSEAYQKAQTIRGKADAEAAQIYAQAFNSSPAAAEFYAFVKTLETYETVISSDTTLVLSTDSDFYSLMKKLPTLTPPPPPTPGLPGVGIAPPADEPASPAPAPPSEAPAEAVPTAPDQP